MLEENMHLFAELEVKIRPAVRYLSDSVKDLEVCSGACINKWNDRLLGCIA